MRALLAKAARGLRRAWWWLRQCSGDAAYDNYLARWNAHGGHADCCGRARPMTREQFWLDALQRRYSRINRCC